jgi:hypothetical protein
MQVLEPLEGVGAVPRLRPGERSISLHKRTAYECNDVCDSRHTLALRLRDERICFSCEKVEEVCALKCREFSSTASMISMYLGDAGDLSSALSGFHCGDYGKINGWGLDTSVRESIPMAAWILSQVAGFCECECVGVHVPICLWLSVSISLRLYLHVSAMCVCVCARVCVCGSQQFAQQCA